MPSFALAARRRPRERPDDDLTTDLESRRVRQALREPIDSPLPRRNLAEDSFSSTSRTRFEGRWARNSSFHAEDSVYRSREFDKGVVTIDRVNIPADDALCLCLGHFGLTYRVQSGYVRIVPDAYEPLPFARRPGDDRRSFAAGALCRRVRRVSWPRFFAGRRGRRRD